MCPTASLVQAQAACLSSRAPDYLVNIVYDMNHKSMGDICEEDLEAKLDSFTYHYNPCKKSPLGNWQHFVLRMNIMWQAMVRWQSCNKVVRELQHRAPALCSYMESMIQLDSQEILPATCPPATTNPSGRTRKVMPTPYPFTVERCPHDAEAARRYGNAHGRFMECLQCGAVRKAFNEDYMNPITGEKVVVHGIRHGRKKQPGGKIEPVLRDSPNLSAKLASCYSLSSLPTSAPSESTPKTGATSSKTLGPLPSTRKSSKTPASSPEWEHVGMED